MPTKDEIIDALTEKCEGEFDYYELVNEHREEVNFRLIVEYIVDIIFDVWEGGNNAD